MAFHDEDCSSVSTTEYEEKIGFLLDTPLRTRKKPYLNKLHTVSWVLQTLLFLSSVTLFVNSRTKSCVRKQSVYSPALDAISDNYKPVRFNGSLLNDGKSPYRGKPSPELDAMWDEITSAGYLSVPVETIRKIGASEDSVRVPPEMGGGYMAEVAVFHQLHCVNLLWMGTHLEYYQEHSVSWSDPPWMIREHLDHCADILRQKLQCDADAGLLTFDWVEGYPGPFENFNAQHKCRDFGALKRWVEDNSFQYPSDGVIPKVPGSVIHKQPPTT